VRFCVKKVVVVFFQYLVAVIQLAWIAYLLLAFGIEICRFAALPPAFWMFRLLDAGPY